MAQYADMTIRQIDDQTPSGELIRMPRHTQRAPAVSNRSALRSLPVKTRFAATKISARAGAIIGPFIAIACGFAAWSLTADMRFTRPFLWPEGPLNHWMVWIGIALLLHFLASRMNPTRQENPRASVQSPDGWTRFLVEMRDRNERAQRGDSVSSRYPDALYRTRDAA